VPHHRAGVQSEPPHAKGTAPATQRERTPERSCSGGVATPDGVVRCAARHMVRTRGEAWRCTNRRGPHRTHDPASLRRSAVTVRAAPSTQGDGRNTDHRDSSSRASAGSALDGPFPMAFPFPSQGLPSPPLVNAASVAHGPYPGATAAPAYHRRPSFPRRVCPGQALAGYGGDGRTRYRLVVCRWHGRMLLYGTSQGFGREGNDRFPRRQIHRSSALRIPPEVLIHFDVLQQQRGLHRHGQATPRGGAWS
jgi:hypothetical protein